MEKSNTPPLPHTRNQISDVSGSQFASKIFLCLSVENQQYCLFVKGNIRKAEAPLNLAEHSHRGLGASA